MTTDYQIVYRAIVHDQQGYARASREYILALDRAGVDIKIEPLNFGTPPAKLSSEQAKRIKELIQKPLSTTKKKILIYHAQPYGVNAIQERKNGYDKVIIMTVWETTKIPDAWFPYVNYADAVLVPSKQNVQALVDSGVTAPIYLVHHGADIHTYNENNAPFEIEGTKDTFNFLSVFQWQHRKAPEALLEAYLKEFTSSDNVSLVIKSYWGNNGLKADQRNVRQTIINYKQHLGVKDTAPIYFTGSLFSDDDMRKLYALADVYVLPSRGEGVGLPYIEAMCSGVPSIATGWGGQIDFINHTNGYLIDYKLEQTNSKAQTAISQHFFNLFSPDMKWAEPNVDSLREAMRYVYEHQEEVKQKGKKARKDMELMTWDEIGIILKDTVERVLV